MNFYSITTALRLPTTRSLIRNLSAAASAKKPKLPRLPVPPLLDTLKKYLKSVKPFLNEIELKITEGKIKELGCPGGIGETLQCLLENRAKNTRNWLEEWWLNIAYLQFRSPVVFYSSPGLVFPFNQFECADDKLEYAAKVISAAVDYKLLIDNNKFPQEKMGKNLLDMSQYSKVFGTCRIPCMPGDKLVFNKDSDYIIVISNNHFFKLEVITFDNDVYSHKQITKALEMIVKESKCTTLPIGILTSENRDKWATAYTKLIEDPVNEKSLDTIANSLFTLSLDKRYDSSKLVTCKNDHMTVGGYQMIIGGGPDYNGGNRWYDKTIQFIVDDKGHNGLTYEHSPAEGQPVAVMTDYIIDYITKNKTPSTDPPQGCIEPVKLKFRISDDIKTTIKDAEKNLSSLLKNMDLQCFKFCEYGKDFIKSQKMSPDSYIQMAIQLAFYRIHKKPGAHYASAATRMFEGGRTETIRSCSEESIAFCKTMLNPNAEDVEKVKALKTAITAHKDYTNEALQGRGIDRHLLGLKLIAAECEMPLPSLFKDVSFTRSSTMRISTSQVAAKCDGFMVYAPIVEDGYSCCYNPRPEDINFGTSTLKSCEETNTLEWKEAIIQSLTDMQCALINAPESKL